MKSTSSITVSECEQYFHEVYKQTFVNLVSELIFKTSKQDLISHALEDWVMPATGGKQRKWGKMEACRTVGRFQASWTYSALEYSWTSYMSSNLQLYYLAKTPCAPFCYTNCSVLDWTLNCCQKSVLLPPQIIISCLGFTFCNLLLDNKFPLSYSVKQLLLHHQQDTSKLNCFSMNPVHSLSIMRFIGK